MNMLLAFFVSPFPKRYWGTARGGGIFVSACLQVALSFAAFMQAYDVYAKKVGQDLADSAIAEAASRNAEKVEAAPAMALAALTPITFLTDSTTGRLFAYLLLSGIFRVVGYAADHPCGDPILTLVDEVVWGIGESIKTTVLSVASRVRSLF